MTQLYKKYFLEVYWVATFLFLLFAHVSFYGYAFFIIIYSLIIIYSSSAKSVWSKRNVCFCGREWFDCWKFQWFIGFTTRVANNEESCGKDKNILNIPLTSLSGVIFLFKHLWLNWFKQQVAWLSPIWIKHCRAGEGLHKSCLGRTLT